ncbi:sensor histidine kinase [Dactylosporangium sp. NPDC049525]|uniref:sensor histidine kinase n=1 Tax=Dactylosporangium sp. NPDC049525 TaxID=3154730 RepID=UPI00341AB283
MDDVWNGEHLRRVRTWLFDGGIAGSVLYVTLMERGLEPAVAAIGLVMAVAMLGRRRYPVTVACIVYTAAPLHLLFDDAMRLYDVAVLISMFAVVKYRPQLFWGILAGVGAGLGVVIGAAVEARKTDNFGTITWVVGALTVAVWFSAYGVRTRRLYVASLEERAATLERERDHLGRLAAADERAAIARELHDVVAHSLSVMIVQADGAGYTLDPSAARAREALDTIAATGRDALEDMRRVVSVLRGASPGVEDASRRRVGLAELDRLVERAGLRVDLDTVGTPAGLSVAEELTAYRIVQESLTNTLRHAGPDAKVTLRLEYTPGHVAIMATDDGAGRPTAATGPGGHGLVGMRERVALHGGTVTAGPRFDGGWSVNATIPRAPRAASADRVAAVDEDPVPPAGVLGDNRIAGVVEAGPVVEVGGRGVVEAGGGGVVEADGHGVVEARGDVVAASRVVEAGARGVVEAGTGGVVEAGGRGLVRTNGAGVVEASGDVVEVGARGVVEASGGVVTGGALSAPETGRWGAR